LKLTNSATSSSEKKMTSDWCLAKVLKESLINAFGCADLAA
jgi:hypothetical protein